MVFDMDGAMSESVAPTTVTGAGLIESIIPSFMSTTAKEGTEMDGLEDQRGLLERFCLNAECPLWREHAGRVCRAKI